MITTGLDSYIAETISINNVNLDSLIEKLAYQQH